MSNFLEHGGMNMNERRNVAAIHPHPNPPSEKGRETQRVALGGLNVDDRGEFIVTAITVGTANGLEYPAEVLRKSLDAGLWERVTVFVNHPDALEATRAGGRDLERLAGVFHSPEWREHIISRKEANMDGRGTTHCAQEDMTNHGNGRHRRAAAHRRAAWAASGRAGARGPGRSGRRTPHARYRPLRRPSHRAAGIARCRHPARPRAGCRFHARARRRV